jgi:heat shock protein HslJ
LETLVMTRRFAAAALLVAMALPSAALAADPTAVAPAPALVGGSWQIVAIETPTGSLKVDGKLAIGADLSVSVGCNSMSAQVVSFDGTNLVIGSVATTEIGCPADLAQAESMLAAVLGAGRLVLDGATLSSDGGRIHLSSSDPATPIATPPAGSTVDPETCAKLLGPDWPVLDGGSAPGAPGVAEPGAAGGSDGQSGSGSGSSSSGSTGSGVTTTTDPVDQGPGTVAEPPIAILSPQPAEPPMPPVTVDEPSPELTPVPGGPTTLEEACRALLASLQGGTSTNLPPGVAVDGGTSAGAPTAEKAAVSGPASLVEGAVPFVVGGVALLAIALLVVLLLGRRAQSRRDPSGRPPAGA